LKQENAQRKDNNLLNKANIMATFKDAFQGYNDVLNEKPKTTFAEHFSDYKDVFPEQPKIGLGKRFINTLPALGQTILDQPTYIKGYIANVAEGTRPLDEKNKFDEWSQAANKLQQERQTAPDAQDKTLFGTKADWANTAASIPFSLGSLAAAGAAGLGTSAITMNPVAGYGAQALASGALAHRADSAMFMRQGLDTFSQKMQQEKGRSPTDQELLGEQERLQPYAMQHGLAEAIPEAVGTPIATGLLGKVFSGPAKGLAGRVIKAGVGIAGEELPTETITQQFQHNIESNAGVSDQSQRSMLSPSDWKQSFNEVAVPVLQQAALTGGLAGAGTVLYNKFSGPLTKAANTGAQINETIPNAINIPNAEVSQQEQGNRQPVAPVNVPVTTNARDEVINGEQTRRDGEPISSTDTGARRNEYQAVAPRTEAPAELYTGTPEQAGISNQRGNIPIEQVTPSQEAIQPPENQNGKIKNADERKNADARQRQETLLDQTAGEQPAPAFIPTHVLSDNTPVIQVSDNTYLDNNGYEWTDDYATKLTQDDAKRIAEANTAQQEQQRASVDTSRAEENIPQAESVAENKKPVQEEVKQPWQVDSYTFANEPAYKNVNPFYDKEYNTDNGNSWNQYLDETKNYHKEIVDKALQENQPVPAEVLKDYPDLEAKYATNERREIPVQTQPAKGAVTGSQEAESAVRAEENKSDASRINEATTQVPSEQTAEIPATAQTEIQQRETQPSIPPQAEMVETGTPTSEATQAKPDTASAKDIAEQKRINQGLSNEGISKEYDVKSFNKLPLPARRYAEYAAQEEARKSQGEYVDGTIPKERQADSKSYINVKTKGTPERKQLLSDYESYLRQNAQNKLLDNQAQSTNTPMAVSQQTNAESKTQGAQIPAISEGNVQNESAIRKGSEATNQAIQEPLTEQSLVQKNTTPEEKNTPETSRTEAGNVNQPAKETLTTPTAKETLTPEPLLNQATVKQNLSVPVLQNKPILGYSQIATIQKNAYARNKPDDFIPNLLKRSDTKDIAFSKAGKDNPNDIGLVYTELTRVHDGVASTKESKLLANQLDKDNFVVGRVVDQKKENTFFVLNKDTGTVVSDAGKTRKQAIDSFVTKVNTIGIEKAKSLFARDKETNSGFNQSIVDKYSTPLTSITPQNLSFEDKRFLDRHWDADTNQSQTLFKAQPAAQVAATKLSKILNQPVEVKSEGKDFRLIAKPTVAEGALEIIKPVSTDNVQTIRQANTQTAPQAESPVISESQLNKPTPSLTANAPVTATPQQLKAAARLRTIGQSSLDKALTEINKPRDTHTTRMARNAGSAIDESLKAQALAQTTLNIANAHERGETKALAKVGNKTQIEQLNTLVNQAMYARDSKRWDYQEQKNHKGRPAETEDVEFIKYPKVSENNYEWEKKEVAQQQSRLKAMGINNAQELKAAAKEFIKYRTQKGEEDAITKAERALVGNKGVGIDYFPTPKPLAERMAKLAGIKEGSRVLEPSAGNGNLADAAKANGAKVDTVEISSNLRDVLKAKGYPIVANDFTEYTPAEKYDSVIMNPPFSKNQDIEHVQRAYDMVKPGGKVVAIMGEHAFFASDKKSVAAKEWLDKVGAEVEKLPAGTFQDKSLIKQTGVNARLVTITKRSEPLFSKAETTESLSESEKYSIKFIEAHGLSPKPNKADLVTLEEKGLVKSVPGPMAGRNIYKYTDKGKAISEALKTEDRLHRLAGVKKTSNPNEAKTGQPILMQLYHGSFVDFDKFDNEVLGINTKADSAVQGHFFTDNPKAASHPYYATPTIRQAEEYAAARLGIDINKKVNQYKWNDKDKTNAFQDAIMKWEGIFKYDSNESEREQLLEKYHEEAKTLLNKELKSSRIKDHKDYQWSGITETVFALAEYHRPFGFYEKVKDAVENKNQDLIKEGTFDFAKKIVQLFKPIYDKQRILDEYNTAVRASAKFHDHVYEDDYAPSRFAGKETAPVVYPVYTWLKNPLVYDYENQDMQATKLSYTKVIEKAKEEGRDGAILLNVNDPLPMNSVVMFNTNQIRSINAKFIYDNKDSSDLLASKTTQPATGSTVAQVQAMQPMQSKPIQTMQKAGKLVVMDSVKSLPEGVLNTGETLLHGAWHGGPHDFEKFDSNKIGTGEGAQAFGYGIYFTDEKGIAEHYRDIEKGNAISYKKEFEHNGFKYIPERGMSGINFYKENLNIKDETERYKKRERIYQNEYLKELENSGNFKQGKLYNVELAPKQEEYLDWNKSMLSQSDTVSKALGMNLEEIGRYREIQEALDTLDKNGKLDSPEWIKLVSEARDIRSKANLFMNASDYYHELSRDKGSDKAASDYLHSLGIRGIRYKAEGGKSSANNYVIFSDDDITIKNKYSKSLQGAEALYDPDNDKMYLFANNITEKTLPIVLTHELIHRAEYVDPKIKAVFNRFETDLQNRFNLNAKGIGTKEELDAYKRVITAMTPVENQAIEYRAYLGEQFAKEPTSLTGKIAKIFKELFAQLRMFLMRNGVDFGTVRSLTPADLWAASKYGMAVKQEKVNQDYRSRIDAVANGNLASATPERIYSALHRAILSDKIPKQAMLNANSLKQWLENPGNLGKAGIKADEVYWSGITDFLDAKAANKQKITREDLDAFMRDTGTVRTEDVVLSDDVGLSKEEKELIKEREELIASNSFLAENPNHLVNRARYSEITGRLSELESTRETPVKTKYADSNYVIPGGKNYIERIVTIPAVEAWGGADAVHFGDTGKGKQVMWTREDERVDADGNEGRLVNEFQSRRGQEGRTKGFKVKKVEKYVPIVKLPNEYKVELSKRHVNPTYIVTFGDKNQFWLGFRSGKMIEESTEELAKEAALTVLNGRELSRIREIELKNSINTVPPAPFIADSKNKATDAYITLLFKKTLSDAIDKGQKFVAWTRGDQQSDFYDLSKQIKAVSYHQDKKDFYYVQVNGDTSGAIKVDADKLQDYIGKEAAKKLLEQPKNDRGYQKLSGLDLKIDAPWAAAMYGDENGMDANGKPAMITQAAMEIAKKFGGKVGSVEIEGWVETGQKGMQIPGTLKQPALIITPEMAEKVRSEGMPLFSKQGQRLAPNGKPSNLNAVQYAQVRTPEFKAWFKNSQVIDENGDPKPMFQGTAEDISEFNGFVKWFAADKKFASEYAEMRDYNKGTGGNVIPAFLKSEHPFDADRLTKGDDTIASFVTEMAQQAKDNGIKFNNEDVKKLLDIIKQSAREEESGPHYFPYNFWMENTSFFGTKGSKAISDLFNLFKFDSINFTEDGIQTVGVLNPNQVKSAIGNTGAFSPTNNNILFSMRSQTEEQPTDLQETSNNYFKVSTEIYEKRGNDEYRRVPVEIIKTDDYKLMDTLEILPGGHIKFYNPLGTRSEHTNTLKNWFQDFIAEKINKEIKDTKGFWRFTFNKNEPKLIENKTIRNSINHADNFSEKGIAVTNHPGYGVLGYKYGYKVDGEIVGYGSDGEPLLNSSTIKVISPIKTTESIDKWYFPKRNKALKKILNQLKMSFDVYEALKSGSFIELNTEEFYKNPLVNVETVSTDLGNTGAFSTTNNNILFSTRSQTEEQSTNLPEETKLEAARRVVQDKMIRFKTIQEDKELKASKQGGYTGTDINEARAYMKAKGIVNPVRDETNVYQADSIREGIATELIKDFDEMTVRPLVKEAQAANLTLDDISDFLKMQHAEEANKRIRKIKPDQPTATAYGVEDAEAQAAMAAYKARPDYAQLKAVADKWRSITDLILQMKVKEGIIPQSQADAYHATFQLYVPVKGADEGIQGTGKGLSVYAKDKRRLGHGERDERIIENIIKDYKTTIIAIEKNKIGRIAANFIREVNDPEIGTIGQPVKRQVFMPGAKHYMVTYHGSDVMAFDNINDARRYADEESLKLGRVRKDFIIDTTTEDGRVVLMAKPMLADNEFQYYENGAAIRGQWNDELLARAYKNLGIDEVGKIIEGARIVNSYLSKAYTGWSPQFIIKNPIRDAIQGFITNTSKFGIKEAGKIMAAYPHAMKELYKHFKNYNSSEEVNAYRKSGGSTGAAYMSDTDRIGRDMMDAYNEYAGAVDTYNRTYNDAIAAGRSPTIARINALAKAGKAGFTKTPFIGHFVNLMERMNSITENALRLATFNTLKADGYSNAQAAAAAKDLMNFNRKGEMTTQLGALYLFFNPNMQGTHVLLSALTSGPHKQQARALAGTMVLAAYLAAEAMRGGGDDDEEKWKMIPGNLKDRNLIFGSGDTKYMLPVPYGYGIFHTLGNALSDVAHGESGYKAGIRLTAALFDNFSPFGNPIDSEHGAFQLLPTMPKMVLATSVNENNFGAPIMPDKWNEAKPDSQTMWRNTKGSAYAGLAETMNNLSGGSKYKAGLVDVSPESLRFWLTSLTGGAGQFALDSINAGMTGTKGAAIETKEIPVVKAFTHEVGVQDARQAYYKAVDEAKEAAGSFRLAKAAHDTEAMAEMMKDNAPLLALAKFATKQQKMIKSLRDAQDSIRISDMPLAQKRLQLKEMEKKEMQVYENFLLAFGKVK
jgi:predicted RNA methylase